MMILFHLPKLIIGAFICLSLTACRLVVYESPPLIAIEVSPIPTQTITTVTKPPTVTPTIRATSTSSTPSSPSPDPPATQIPYLTETQTPIPSPTETVTKTIVPTQVDTPTPTNWSKRTGIAEIDQILDLLESKNRDGLRQQIQLTSYACTNETGIGGPPKCFYYADPPLPEGAMVELLPIRAPVVWPREEELDSWLDRILSASNLNAVYQMAQPEGDLTFGGLPASEAVILVNDVALMLKNGKIVAIRLPLMSGEMGHSPDQYLIGGK